MNVRFGLNHCFGMDYKYIILYNVYEFEMEINTTIKPLIKNSSVL